MSEVRKFSIKEAEKTRTIPFVFSDESRDAHGTILPVSGWDLDRFNKNGIAFYQHNSGSSDPDQIIGRAKAWIEKKELLGEITFENGNTNPLAEKVFQKFLTGTLNAVSVGFLPKEKGRWGEGKESLDGEMPTYYYGKRELLEISVVSIPSNKNAIARALGSELDQEVSSDEGYFATGCVRELENVESEEAPESKITEEQKQRADAAYDKAMKSLGYV